MLFGGFLLLGIAALLGWIVVEGVRADPGLVGALATTGITVVSGIAIAGWQARVQRRENAERLQRETITPFYDRLIRQVSRQADAAEGGNPSQETIETLGEIQHQMLMWSNARTVATWVDAMRLLETEPEPEAATLAWGRVLRAIRAELGHDDTDLDTRTLLRIFINDIDEHLPAGIQ